MTDTLKSICEQCTHLHNPQLNFISVDLIRQREIIIRDIRELVSAASVELDKTVVVLAGCILESVLYSFLQGQKDYIAQRRGSFTFNPDQGLENYVNIFNRWFSDILPNTILPDLVIEYRNLIHINREVSSPPEICALASREMLRRLNVLMGELSMFAGPGGQ